MQITRISVFQLSLPLHKPYWLSGGRLRFDELDSTIVNIETDAGISGWGEGCPWGSTYLPAFGKGIRAGIAELAPSLIGEDPRELDNVNRAMDLALPGHPYVKSAIDIACWDILGQATGLSLAALLGGRCTDRTPIASSVSTGTPAEMLAEIERFRAQGYKVHSAKVGADVRLDIERIRHLAEIERAEETIFFDANRAWLPREAITAMNAVSELPVFFEQPCETHDECLQVRRATTSPISLDEGIKSFADLVWAHREKACEVVNIKINRVGGLTKARRMRDFCLGTGITMLIMDTGGTVVSDTAVTQLATTIPTHQCLGVWSCQDMVTVDPAPGRGARNVEGHLTAPSAPGLGVAPLGEILGAPEAVYQ